MQKEKVTQFYDRKRQHCRNLYIGFTSKLALYNEAEEIGSSFYPFRRKQGIHVDCIHWLEREI